MSGGGALGLGKSKSSNQSTAESSGESSSISGNQSMATSGSNQQIAFGDMYSKLYGGAAGAAGDALAGAPELAGTARQLFTGGSQFLQGLGNDAGTDYLTKRLSGDNPELQAQIDQMRTDTGRLFSENFNPAITAGAVSDGTLGGGRQGVAQGAAMDSLARQFTVGSTALRSSDLAQRDQAAQTIAATKLQAASTGLGSLPSLLDLMTSGNDAGLNIFGKLSATMGGPTTLTTAQSQSISDAFSKSFGTQQSQGQSSGKSNSWNFNMSGYGGVG